MTCDDATVLLTAIGMISNHLKPEHREQAERTLNKMRKGAAPHEADGGPHG